MLMWLIKDYNSLIYWSCSEMSSIIINGTCISGSCKTLEAGKGLEGWWIVLIISMIIALLVTYIILRRNNTEVIWG